jgi:23S rRNA (guanosine2251-2'-O)-methyltransferase
MRQKSATLQKRYRNKSKDNNYIIYGERCCLSVIKNQSRKIFEALVTNQTEHKVIHALQEYNVKNIKTVEKTYLNRLCTDSGRHQNIIIKTGDLIRKTTLEEQLENNGKKNFSCFLLDNIQDPHNVGAIIRSSYCFDIDFIVVSDRNTPNINATIVRTSTGLSEVVPIYIFPNLTRAINVLQKHDFWVFGMENSKTAEFLDKSLQNFTGNTAFILGSEGYGIGKHLKNYCDTMIKIPIQNNADSLNVSNAAAIVAYQRYLYQNKTNHSGKE